MSGPIVRRYGFPNFEKIFGERELKHGAEGTSPSPQSSDSPESPKSDRDVEADKPEPNAPTSPNPAPGA